MNYNFMHAIVKFEKKYKTHASVKCKTNMHAWVKLYQMEEPAYVKKGVSFLPNPINPIKHLHRGNSVI